MQYESVMDLPAVGEWARCSRCPIYSGSPHVWLLGCPQAGSQDRLPGGIPRRLFLKTGTSCEPIRGGSGCCLTKANHIYGATGSAAKGTSGVTFVQYMLAAGDVSINVCFQVCPLLYCGGSALIGSIEVFGQCGMMPAG